MTASLFQATQDSSNLTFSNNLSYQFHDDYVTLCADIEVSELVLMNGLSCSLQLWATDNGYFGGELQGAKIAEINFNPLYSAFNLQDRDIAFTPADQKPYQLVMVLVSRNQDGFEQIEDFSNFANLQRFQQPCFNGNVDVNVTHDNVAINIASISNTRQNGGISNPLSLELWATPEPYRGYDFAGHWLGGIELGQLNDGFDWVNCHYDLPLAGLPEGGWSLVLMLREQTLRGFITRDYRLLPPLLAKAAEQPVAKENNVVELDRFVQPDADKTQEDSNKAAEAKVADVDAKVDAKDAKETKAPAVEKNKVVLPQAPKADKKVSVSKDVAAKKTDNKDARKTVAKGNQQSQLISINEATVEELARVKGLSAKLAERIKAERPYDDLDDLLTVNGIGARLLNNVRKYLTV